MARGWWPRSSWRSPKPHPPTWPGIQEIPVVSGEALGPPGQGLLLVCVGVRWAREALRADLAARGWVEGVDFLCAA
jgi:hypothetical protein